MLIALEAVGLVLLGCVSVTARTFGLHPEYVLGTYAVLGLAGSIWRVQHDARQECLTPIGRPIVPLSRIEALVALAWGVMLGSALLVYSFHMGVGPTPATFYGVDNAYLLSIVESLFREDTFPPRSLTYVGYMGAYHYAMLDSGAMLARLTGLLPHQGFFLVGLSMTTIGTVAASWLIARQMARGWLRLAIMAMLYLGTFYQSALKFAKGVLPALHQVLTGQFDNSFPLALPVGHVITQAGMLLAIFTVFLALYDDRRSSRLAITAVAGASALVKVQHFIAIDLWLLCISLYAFMAARPWRHAMPQAIKLAISLAWPAIATFVLGMTLMRLGHYAESDRHIVIAWFANDYVNENLVETIQHAAILFMPALIAAIFACGRGLAQSAIICGILGVAPLILVSTTALTLPDGGDTDFNWFQTTAPAAIAIALCAAQLVASFWSRISKIGRYVVGISLAICIGTQTMRFPLMALDTIIHRDHGEQAMDNGDLTAALAVIPIAGSVIVTNDLRSPAENYKRPDRQTQVPAIFGHQCFLITPAYDLALPDIEVKKAAQELLQAPTWSPDIAANVRRYGWTHFLVHKSAPFPGDIPLQRVYDSATYSVYRF